MSLLPSIETTNSSRHRLWEENENFSKQVLDDDWVLDAGAGSAPYKPLFKHAHYESADFEQVDKPYARSTYVCDLKEIPVENERFNYVVFNQVMEHLPEPSLVLAELNRVLKPGGKMIYTGPLFYEEHEQPYDFYRYTQYGLRHLFDSADFEVERLDWLEGYFGTVGYQLECMSKYLPSSPSIYGGGIKGVAISMLMKVLRLSFSGLAVLFHRLEIRTKFTQYGHPKNYVAIVSKRTKKATA